MKTRMLRSLFVTLLLSLTLGVTGCDFSSIMSLFTSSAGQSLVKQGANSLASDSSGGSGQNKSTPVVSSSSRTVSTTTSASRTRPTTTATGPSAPVTPIGTGPATNVQPTEKTAISGKDE